MDTNIYYQSVVDIARLLAASEHNYVGDDYDATWNDHWNWFQSNRRAHDGSPNLVHSNLTRWHAAAVQIISYLAEKGSFRSGVETSRIEILESENEQLRIDIDLLDTQNENLIDKVSDLSEQLENLRVEYDLSEREVERLEAELDTANIEIENLNFEVEQLENRLAHNESFETPEAEVIEITDRATVLDEIRKTMDQIRRNANNTSVMRIALANLPNAIDRLCDLLEE